MYMVLRIRANTIESTNSDQQAQTNMSTPTHSHQHAGTFPFERTHSNHQPRTNTIELTSSNKYKGTVSQHQVHGIPSSYTLKLPVGFQPSYCHSNLSNKIIQHVTCSYMFTAHCALIIAQCPLICFGSVLEGHGLKNIAQRTSQHVKCTSTFLLNMLYHCACIVLLNI